MNWIQVSKYKGKLSREHVVMAADRVVLVSGGFWSKTFHTPHVAIPTIDSDEVLSQLTWDSTKQRTDGSTYYRFNTESIPKGKTTWVIV